MPGGLQENAAGGLLKWLLGHAVIGPPFMEFGGVTALAERCGLCQLVRAQPKIKVE